MSKASKKAIYHYCNILSFFSDKACKWYCVVDVKGVRGTLTSMKDANALLKKVTSSSSDRAIIPMKDGAILNPVKLKAFLDKKSGEKTKWWKHPKNIPKLKQKCKLAPRPKACVKPPKKPEPPKPKGQ